MGLWTAVCIYKRSVVNTELIVNYLSTTGLQIGLKILAAIAVWVIGKFVINGISGMAKRLMEKRNVEPTLVRYLHSALRIALTILLIIAVLGQDVLALDQEALDRLRVRIGFLFQSSALYDSMTVQENLEFPLRRHWIARDPKEKEALVEEVLSAVGLPQTRKLYPSELSGGMKRRIGLARTLILKPEIVLYDEPTTGLDPVTGKEIVELILKLQRAYNTSSIIISHDLNVAKLAANREAFMATMSGLSAEQWEMRAYSEGSEWRVVDILRHVADSERGMTALMVQIKSGGEGVPPDFDLARWNQRVVNKLGDKDPQELLAGMADSRRALLGFIDSLEESDWDKKGRHASLKIMTIEEVCHLIADHEALHLTGVREALGDQ